MSAGRSSNEPAALSGRLARSSLYATPLVLLMVVAGLAAALPAGSAAGLGALTVPTAPLSVQVGSPMASSSPALLHSGAPPALSALPAQIAPLASSGPGTFFNTSSPALPPAGNQTCYSTTGGCSNITYDPSINYTSRGVLAVAYTAYSNESPCSASQRYAQSEVGFSISHNRGATWSTPTYLGNPVCDPSNATNFTSAWEPSLSSLSNGTLVLAYIEYNISGATCYFDFLPNVQFAFYQYSGFGYSCYNVPSARLVLTESYDNGSTWSTPTVLNSSYNPGFNQTAYAPERPSVATWGNTIYVAWYNETIDLGNNYTSFPYTGLGSTQVHLLVSTNGGTSWGAMQSLKVFPGNGAQYAENPALLVLPSGQLDVFYSSQFDYWYYYGCVAGNCYYGIWTASIYLATSTNNGTSFSYSVAVNNSTADVYRGAWEDPIPSVAYSSVNHQLFVGYGGDVFRMFCTQYNYCYNSTTEDIFLANSSDGGLTWSNHLVSPLLNGGGNYFQVYNVAVGVGSSGEVYVVASYDNDSQTIPYYYGTWYGTASEVFLSSTDNGTSFAGPFQIGNATANMYYPDGNSASMVTVGSAFYAAYGLRTCPSTAMMSPYYYYCDWYPIYYNELGYTNVTIASLYNGTGVTVTFSETGLLTGTDWSVNMMGNLRTGSAPTSLSISGVPINTVVSWNLSNPNGGYGIRYTGSPSVSSPASFGATTTVSVTFSEQVLINLYAVPSLPPLPTYIGGCYGYDEFWYNNPYCASATYNVTATSSGASIGPGYSMWADAGAPVAFNVSADGIGWCAAYAYCYSTYVLNLTFESWTGTGNGSFNTTGNFTTVTPYTPLNETANFDVNGWCYYYFAGAILGCFNSNASIYFTQSGLPANVTWNVTLSNKLATETASGTSPILSIKGNATLGVPSYFVWSVPSTGGKYWVGTGNPPSPIELPMQRVVNINYTLVDPNQQSFPVLFNATGLPNSTAWSLELGSGSLTQSYGIRSSSWLTTLQGGQYTVTGATVYLENGTAYYPASVIVTPFVVNESTTTNTSLPAGFVLAGASVVTVHFAPEYWLTVSANAGGNVTGTDQWVHPSQTINLTATPDSTHLFVGWTGIGVGSVTASTPTISVRPGGPVEELATFRPTPPSLAQVAIAATGLPSGTNFTITVGNMSYSGAGAVGVSVLPGVYDVELPIVYLNGSDLTRFLPTVSSTSYASASGGLDINGNGWINISYSVQYQVTLAATGPGTISPAPGATWVDAGVGLTVTATPQPGFMVGSWNGTGLGSVNVSKQLSVTLTIGGPVAESVLFVVKPPVPPATYNLQVSATNLPNGASWSAAVPGNGATGSTATLSIAGLNGSYTLSVPDVYTATGVRYVPNGTGNYSVSVTANSTFAVQFSPEYLVTVVAGSGGAVTGVGGWYASGAVVQLSATPNSTSTFLNWTGSGTGSVSSTQASISLTVSAPTTETANFGAKAQQVSNTNSTAGMPIALGLLIALLLVGLIVGLLLGRRRGGGRAAPQAYEGPSAPAGDAGAETAAPEAPAATPDWQEEGSSTESSPVEQ